MNNSNIHHDATDGGGSVRNILQIGIHTVLQLRCHSFGLFQLLLQPCSVIGTVIIQTSNQRSQQNARESRRTKQRTGNVVVEGEVEIHLVLAVLLKGTAQLLGFCGESELLLLQAALLGGQHVVAIDDELDLGELTLVLVLHLLQVLKVALI